MIVKPSFHAHSLATQIDQARHHQFMKEALPHLIGGMLTAILLYFIYRPYGTDLAPIIWLMGNCVLLACTVVFYSIYYLRPQWLSIPQWGWITFIVAGLWGVCWALPPHIFLATDNLLYIAVMIVILVALSTSPAPAMVHYPSAYYAFITLPLASLFYKLTQIDIGEDWVMLMLTPFLWVSLLGYGWGLHGTMINAIKLRLENEQAWREAESANLAKSKFLAAASHDIRQPLQAINFFLSAIKDGDDKDESLLNRLEASVDSMSGLLNSLLDVSKLDAQAVDVKNQHILLHDFGQKIVGQAAEEARVKGLALELLGEDEVVYGDPVLLERVLNNLMSNAIRYTESGFVRLILAEKEDAIEVSVVDSGRGIPLSEQEAVFSEFHQLDNPERDRNKGLGLGLAIVRRLCELQQWPLHLHSEENIGSTFSVVLPKGKAALVPRPTPQVLVHQKELNILVVDDETDVRESLGSLLESWGHKVWLAEDIDSACQQAQSIELDLLISDYRLRDNVTGVTLVQAVQAIQSDVSKVLIITGDTDPQRIKEVKASGFSLLHKPVKPGQLRTFIQRQFASC